jgi:hypothetical protein
MEMSETIKTIQWNREKLYEEVWTRPTCDVARDYGISDVALAKICKKLSVPKPGPGYWRRKECGYKVARPPLPEVKQIPFLVSHVPTQPSSKPTTYSENPPILKSAAATTRRHPLVVQTERAFVKGTPDNYGRIRARDLRLPRLNLKVTKTCLGRALHFMDELLKLLEANNMTIRVGSEHDASKTVVTIEGEQLTICLKEAVRTTTRELTPMERRDHERHPSLYPRDYAPAFESTNRFTFEIESYSDGPRTWTDRKKGPLEECLFPIANALLIAAAYAKRARAEREAERKRREREERRRWRHQQRVERLRNNMASWEEAQRVRAYLSAVEYTQCANGNLPHDSRTARFLAWARQYAEYLDPTGAPAASDWDEDDDTGNA